MTSYNPTRLLLLSLAVCRTHSAFPSDTALFLTSLPIGVAGEVIDPAPTFTLSPPAGGLLDLQDNMNGTLSLTLLQGPGVISGPLNVAVEKGSVLALPGLSVGIEGEYTVEAGLEIAEVGVAVNVVYKKSFAFTVLHSVPVELRLVTTKGVFGASGKTLFPQPILQLYGKSGDKTEDPGTPTRCTLYGSSPLTTLTGTTTILATMVKGTFEFSDVIVVEVGVHTLVAEATLSSGATLSLPFQVEVFAVRPLPVALIAISEPTGVENEFLTVPVSVSMVNLAGDAVPATIHARVVVVSAPTGGVLTGKMTEDTPDISGADISFATLLSNKPGAYTVQVEATLTETGALITSEPISVLITSTTIQPECLCVLQAPSGVAGRQMVVDLIMVLSLGCTATGVCGGSAVKVENATIFLSLTATPTLGAVTGQVSPIADADGRFIFNDLQFSVPGDYVLSAVVRMQNTGTLVKSADIFLKVPESFSATYLLPVNAPRGNGVGTAVQPDLEMEFFSGEGALQGAEEGVLFSVFSEGLLRGSNTAQPPGLTATPLDGGTARYRFPNLTFSNIGVHIVEISALLPSGITLMTVVRIPVNPLWVEPIRHLVPGIASGRFGYLFKDRNLGAVIASDGAVDPLVTTPCKVQGDSPSLHGIAYTKEGCLFAAELTPLEYSEFYAEFVPFNANQMVSSGFPLGELDEKKGLDEDVPAIETALYALIATLLCLVCVICILLKILIESRGETLRKERTARIEAEKERVREWEKERARSAQPAPESDSDSSSSSSSSASLSSLKTLGGFETWQLIAEVRYRISSTEVSCQTEGGNNFMDPRKSRKFSPKNFFFNRGGNGSGGGLLDGSPSDSGYTQREEEHGHYPDHITPNAPSPLFYFSEENHRERTEIFPELRHSNTKGSRQHSLSSNSSHDSDPKSHKSKSKSQAKAIAEIELLERRCLADDFDHHPHDATPLPPDSTPLSLPGWMTNSSGNTISPIPQHSVARQRMNALLGAPAEVFSDAVIGRANTIQQIPAASPPPPPPPPPPPSALKAISEPSECLFWEQTLAELKETTKPTPTTNPAPPIQQKINPLAQYSIGAGFVESGGGGGGVVQSEVQRTSRENPQREGAVIVGAPQPTKERRQQILKFAGERAAARQVVEGEGEKQKEKEKEKENMLENPQHTLPEREEAKPGAGGGGGGGGGGEGLPQPTPDGSLLSPLLMQAASVPEVQKDAEAEGGLGVVQKVQKEGGGGGGERIIKTPIDTDGVAPRCYTPPTLGDSVEVV